MVIVYEKWGGISSEEHDEAVMLEAAMFGGIPGGGAGYREPYATRSRTQNSMNRIGGPYQRQAPRPPSPSRTVQRLIRTQQVIHRNLFVKTTPCDCFQASV